MWIRLCLKYEIYILPEKLVRFRVRNNEANASGNRLEVRIRAAYEYYKLLPNYSKIKSFDDLVKVFPSAEKYYRNEGADMDFVLAMVALEEKSFAPTQLFGQDLLFEAISDPTRAANIKQLYGFDRMRFFALTGQHDVFSREAIAERDGQIASLSQAVAERDGQIASLSQAVAERDGQIVSVYASIAEIRESISWRLTAPVRMVSSNIRKILRTFNVFK
jgi:hypothetical protein